MILQKILASLIRRRTPAVFNDLGRTDPISSVFGYDRGTPIDRYYIERFLEKNSNLIVGDVLEVGDNIYTKKYGGKNVARSWVLNASTDVNAEAIDADLTDFSTLSAGVYDCFICTQTLNFIFDVNQAVANASYVLKPGGVFLVTVAGISQISRYDMDRWGDYWRFTSASALRLLKPVFGESVQIESYGNCLAACSLLQGIAVEDLPDSSLLNNNDPDYQVVISIVARKSC